jgi:hypothetical protein
MSYLPLILFDGSYPGCSSISLSLQDGGLATMWDVDFVGCSYANDKEDEEQPSKEEELSS